MGIQGMIHLLAPVVAFTILIWMERVAGESGCKRGENENICPMAAVLVFEVQHARIFKKMSLDDLKDAKFTLA